jgi:hypothetical protein
VIQARIFEFLVDIDSYKLRICQSLWRGLRGRREARRQLNCTVNDSVIESIVHFLLGIVMIQRCWRMFQSKKFARRWRQTKLREMNKAATKLQAYFRGTY